MSVILPIVFCAVLVAVDQAVKFLVIEYLKPIEYLNVLDGFLRLRYVENSGAVFGSFASHTLVLTVFSIILLGVTIYFLATN